MKFKMAVDPIWILLLICSYASSKSLCPDECTCSDQGSSGSFARCHGAFPHFSSFGYDLNHLDVSDAAEMPEFSLVPSYFSGSSFKNLVSVRIRNTSLVSVQEKTFDGLSHLYDIDLSDNPFLVAFHLNAVSGAHQLRILSFSGSFQLFTTMSGPIISSDSLRELDLSRCGIVKMHPEAFSLIPTLSYLNLANNDMSSIPPQTFDHLLALEDLDLSGNALSSLPGDIFLKNTELSVLMLRGNPISKIPETIFGDKENILVELDVSGTDLTSLEIPPMRELNHLNLNGSQISSVDKLAMFPHLRYLNLSETKISSLENNSFAGNLLLETLHLSGNPKLRLPARLESEFNFLYLVDLSNCLLEELGPDLFLQMKQIATLNLSRNSISDSAALSKALSPLSNLRVLDLSHNKLRVIEDADLKKNRGLTTLILSGNPLISPPFLENFPTILRLDMSHCTLSRVHLPLIFRQGPKLRHISLAGNNLFTIYDQAFLNPDEDDSPWNPPQHLAVLDLSENPWMCEPSFTSLLYEMIKRGVAPSTESPPDMVKQGFPRDLDAEWRLLEMQACEEPSLEIEITLITEEPPMEKKVVLNAQFTLWMIVGVLLGICLVATFALIKAFGCNLKERHARTVKVQIPPDAGKVNVSLIAPQTGAKKVRVKDYQRLHEDRSPGSPLTPRIYRPPPGTQFPYPELDAKAPECDKNCEEDCGDTNNDQSKEDP